MDFQTHKLYSPKHSNKKRLNQEQVSLLEKSFNAKKKLEPELKLQLANQLGVPPKQVAIWYQNKRARWKTQSLELDYNTLQVKLENALSEKTRLEKDVKFLQEELRKAQEMMMMFGVDNNSQRGIHYRHHQDQQLHPLNVVSCNSTGCSEEGGSSSFHEDDHVEVLQIDELYACLIGADRST